MKKITHFLNKSILLSILLLPSIIHADGLIMVPEIDRDFSKETNQQAFINYENGFEKMIISVGTEGENKEGQVWLFPVPSKPEGVVIDIIDSLPELSGDDVLDKAKIQLEDSQEFFLEYNFSYFIFPALLNETLGVKSSYSNSYGVLMPFEIVDFGNEDIEIHEHIEKEGIISEIITAKTAKGLDVYLKDKGINLKEKSIPVLDNYIGKDYSFVVSWINPDEQKTSNQVGLFVTFPTDKMYFPLLPTSVYESEIVPATIRVIGYVTPEIFDNIKNYTKIGYYKDDYSYLEAEAGFFYKGDKDIKYTKIEIESPSKYLTDDLWIKNKAPLKVSLFGFIGEHSFLSLFLIMLISAVLSGLILSFIFFKGMKRRRLKTILISLFNLLTALGLIIKLAFTKTKEDKKDIETEGVLMELREKGYLWRRKISIFSLFLATFTFPFFLVTSILSLSNPFNYSFERLLSFLALNLPFMVSLVVFLLLKRIKIKDTNLFKVIKEKGYSSWTFLPKDKQKIYFFFVSHLLYVWLVVGVFFCLLSIV